MRMEEECVVGGSTDVVLATRPNNSFNSFSDTLSSHAPYTRYGHDDPPLGGLRGRKVVTLRSCTLSRVIV